MLQKKLRKLIILINNFGFFFVTIKKKGNELNIMQESPILLNKSTIEVLNLENEKNNLGASVILARNEVPDSHRRQADAYMILKTHYGMPVINPSINLDEKKFLARFDFNPLEYSTVKQINDELIIMQDWSYSLDKDLAQASDKIMAIRVKELKSIIASKYVKISNEIYNGYKALERYLEEISKYH